MIAHIVSSLPLPLQWGLALLIFGGGLVVFAVRRSALRIAGGVAALCGAGGLGRELDLQPGAARGAHRTLCASCRPHPELDVGAPLTLTVCGVPGVRRAGSSDVVAVLPRGHPRRRPGAHRRCLARAGRPPRRPAHGRGRARVSQPPVVQSAGDVQGDDHGGAGRGSGRSGVLLTDEHRARTSSSSRTTRRCARSLPERSTRPGYETSLATHGITASQMLRGGGDDRHRPARHRPSVRRRLADPRADGQPPPPGGDRDQRPRRGDRQGARARPRGRRLPRQALRRRRIARPGSRRAAPRPSAGRRAAGSSCRAMCASTSARAR